jgi:hypothetical protein
MIIWLGVGVIVLGLFGSAHAEASLGLKPARHASGARAQGWNDSVVRSSAAVTFHVYLPTLLRPQDLCGSTGETYGSLPVTPETWSPETHPDINLAVRGYTPADYLLGLIDVNGTTDPGAPQLAGVFAVMHAPTIMTVYQVGAWDWNCNCVIGPISPPEDPEVTLINLAATPGDLVRVPDRNARDIGLGYKAMVLYAAPNRITLKYTSEDNMKWGYGLYLENICVDASLLAFYNQLHSQGRHELPALNAGQTVGRVPGASFGLAIRDDGTFMDPRVRKDWWRGY